MTVIFAAISPEEKFGFLGADDRDGHSPRPKDKVLVLDRFVVAAFGASVTLSAARAACALGGTRTVLANGVEYVPPQSASALAGLVAHVLPRVAQHEWALFQAARIKGERTAEQEEELLEQEGHLVILDREELSLHVADFGQAFPPRELYTSTVKSCASDEVLRFGVFEMKNLGPISERLRKNKKHWLTTAISHAVADLIRNGRTNTLGGPGAYFAMDDGEVLQTVNSSLDDLLDEFYPRFNPEA